MRARRRCRLLGPSVVRAAADAAAAAAATAAAADPHAAGAPGPSSAGMAGLPLRMRPSSSTLIGSGSARSESLQLAGSVSERAP